MLMQGTHEHVAEQCGQERDAERETRTAWHLSVGSKFTLTLPPHPNSHPIPHCGYRRERWWQP